MPMAIALACRQLRLTPAEAITAATINGAAVLGWRDAGTLAVGGPATMILLRHADPRGLAFEFATNPVDAVWVDGCRVATRQ